MASAVTSAAAEPASPAAETASVAGTAPAPDPERSDAAPPAAAEVAARETDETPQPPAETGMATAADHCRYRLVQLLQNLQDQIAHGSTQAFAAQRSMLDRIDTIFASEPPATWQQPNNAAALVTYVLSGGRPAVLRQALQSSPPPALDEGLMRGALAYVEGHPARPRNSLGYHARTFPQAWGASSPSPKRRL
jgi:chemotaxis protein MotC